MSENFEIPYSQEVLRKSIHLVSLSIPIGYALLGKETSLKILIPITAIFVIFDILSKKKNKIRDFVYFIFGRMLRPHEINKSYTLNGASWLLLSAVGCILVFPKILTITGFSILIVSDISAALFGRKFGKHKIFGKSIEGMCAFIVSAWLVLFIVGSISFAPFTFYFLGIIACVIAGIGETSSGVLYLDDNVIVPASIGIVMWLGDVIVANWQHISYLHLL